MSGAPDVADAHAEAQRIRHMMRILLAEIQDAFDDDDGALPRDPELVKATLYLAEDLADSARRLEEVLDLVRGWSHE